MRKVIFANCDNDGFYTLEGRPNMKLSKDQFEKYKKLIGSEQGVSHAIVFKDFSGGRKT
ncbi:MAG: hypothetical protein KF860_17310 [Cyclobacteriaceae bacterium]|nr:hypothetical protein [Cyclobacteriaceae bacterium]